MADDAAAMREALIACVNRLRDDPAALERMVINLAWLAYPPEAILPAIAAAIPGEEDLVQAVLGRMENWRWPEYALAAPRWLARYHRSMKPVPLEGQEIAGASDSSSSWEVE